MDKQLVGELPDITESSNDDEIMVITDSQHNQLRKEKISNFIKDLVSNDENNGIKLGTDNKLLSVDASNADNITSGILNPERLPNSGVTEDTYVYPDSITVDKKGRVTKITNGTPGGNNADKDLSNITEAGKDVIRDTAGSGFSLFDVVEKDHILSFEESMGFGLLGTYVYKDAVPGARYGYPDFYNECVAQKEAGTEETITVGDVSFTATKNSNGHIFYDIADKATVDEIFSQRGEAWFYGVDTENERVFLPRGTRSQYTVNTDETGDYVEAGLPNIEGTFWSLPSRNGNSGANGAFTVTSNSSYCADGSIDSRRVSFDASLSNPIYGNSDTVQPYATKKLLYIVVGNVKVQSAASDVVDVTTTENDTVPLFTGQYFNFKPNNPSWLKAGEQQDSGGIYTSCYNKLVQALTDNIWGIKVIDSAAMEEGTDYSEYWIVYQDAMRFRTPLTACKEIMPGNEITSSLGFSSNPTNTVESYTVPYNGYITIIGYKTSTSNTLTVKLNGTIVSQTRALASGLSSESYFFARKGDIVTVSTDSTSTGWVIATQTITKATANGELYFKAANAVENLEILNVGQVMEELSNKVNVSNTSWAASAVTPDFSAGINQDLDTPYTASMPGYVYAFAYGNLEGHLNINGQDIHFQNGNSNSVYVGASCFVPVNKGDVYTFTLTGRSQSKMYFYPMKGAIID